jgi:hypothetical protein
MPRPFARTYLAAADESIWPMLPNPDNIRENSAQTDVGTRWPVDGLNPAYLWRRR